MIGTFERSIVSLRTRRRERSGPAPSLTTKGVLLPGQFVRLTIDLGIRKNAIVVPARAIVQSQADRMVMVVDGDDKVVPRPVRLGPAIAEGVLIESGLDAGERYIVGADESQARRHSQTRLGPRDAGDRRQDGQQASGQVRSSYVFQVLH